MSEETKEKNVEESLPQEYINLLNSIENLGWEVGIDENLDENEPIQGLIIGNKDFINKIKSAIYIAKQVSVNYEIQKNEETKALRPTIITGGREIDLKQAAEEKRAQLIANSIKKYKK